MLEPRTSMILGLALALVGCGGGGGSGDETGDTDASTSGTTAPPTSTTDAMPCTPGEEGCACMAGACDVGLECFSNVCVVPPAAETSGDAETTTPADPSTTESSTSADESTTTDASSSDDGGSSTSAPVLPCLEGNNICQDGELETCVDGERQLSSCYDACAPTGYGSTSCHDINTCECEGFIDDYCIDIATAGCECYASADPGYECTSDEIPNWYDWCWDDGSAYHDFAVCMGEGVIANPNDCEAFANVCFDLL